MKTAILFPGQGAQSVGMGKDVFDRYPASHSIFTNADNALNESISSLCFEGPQEKLNLTANTQPALLATSAALAVALQENINLDVVCVAGHSLGEYTALWFAGALDIHTAIRLVRLRGEAMQAATPQGVGAMAAIIGLSHHEITDVCNEAAQGEVLTAANFNAPGQTVISGHQAAVERGASLAKEQGAKKSILLPVSAPFHCPLMKPASEIMDKELQTATVTATKYPVICNVTAKPITSDPNEIRNALVQQITSAVQWEESIKYMAEQGVELFLEIGPGKVLTNMVKRISPKVKRMNISDIGGIEKLIDFFSNES
ncbi:ACP S-malonyltransferase [bacterium]|nr:ACP S-malonyltransferase [bacterium]